jgi:hypothetical protein
MPPFFKSFYFEKFRDTSGGEATGFLQAKAIIGGPLRDDDLGSPWGECQPCKLAVHGVGIGLSGTSGAIWHKV